MTRLMRLILFMAMLAGGCQATNNGMPALTGKGPSRIPPPPTGTLSRAGGYDRPSDYRLGDARSSAGYSGANYSGLRPSPGLIPVHPNTPVNPNGAIGPNGIEPTLPRTDPGTVAPRITSTPVRPPGSNAPMADEGSLSWRNPGSPSAFGGPPAGSYGQPQDDAYLARQLDPETTAPPFRYRGF